MPLRDLTTSKKLMAFSAAPLLAFVMIGHSGFNQTVNMNGEVAKDPALFVDNCLRSLGYGPSKVIYHNDDHAVTVRFNNKEAKGMQLKVTCDHAANNKGCANYDIPEESAAWLKQTPEYGLVISTPSCLSDALFPHSSALSLKISAIRESPYRLRL